MLETLALTVGRQVATHATKAWLRHRKNSAEQKAQLTDLLATGVPDQFARRKLARQLEDIGDQVARRLTPLIDTEFDLPLNERQAALDAVVDTLEDADLTDSLMLGADMDPVTLAREVRKRIPVTRAGLSEPALKLYNAVLDETCVSLVNVVQHLPTFQPRALTEMLARLSKIEAVLERLPRTSLDAPLGTDHDAEFTSRYLSFLSNTLDQLELFGVDIRRYKPQIPVTVAYLNLSVSGDSEDLRIEHALEHSPRTLLRGQAGSGKTTLLQWIAVNASRSTFTGSLADWNGSIPFLVRLRSYPDGNLPQPQDLVASNASPIAGQTPEGWAHRQFTTGRALLLVDGVDELRAERRPRVRKWLSELLVAFPRIRVVVTSRPSAAEPAWLNGFRSLVLQPMTPADVTAFCRRWHEAIREVGAPAELDEYEIALARQLESRRHLRTLASSPLLCALLCALNLDRHKQLPPDRMKLYEASLELLLERRDAERDLPVVQDLQMATKSKLTILQHLAWWLTLNGRSEASRSEATTQVSLAITRMPDVSGDPTVVLNYLIERSGVIREPVTDRIDFIHRTFQEYLAGKQAAEEHFMDFLVRNAHLDQWRETVVMGAGHATIPLRTTLLNSLLDRASKETRHARRLKIVAASCLDTAHTMTPEVIERVEGALDQLIPPRRPNEARSLSLGGDRVLRRLPQTLDGLTSSQAAACVRTASFIGGQEALKLLTSYAASPDWSAQKEIARAWRYFPAERYAAEVLSDAPLVNGRILVERLEHIHFLQDLTRLTDTWINVLHDRDVDNLTFLANARHLSTLLVGCTPETCVDLRSLSEHSGLQFASIHTPGGHAVNLDALGSLTSLDYLGLPLPPGLSDVEFVRAIPSVRTLRLLEAAGLRDLSALAWLRNLQEFGAWGCPDLPQLPPTTTATRFCFGKIPLQTVIAAIEPLITQITSLHLDYCYGDLSLLMSPTLTSLELREYAMTDLSPLANLPSLRTLKYDGEVDVDLGPNVTVKRWR